jgi:hypothetical protein
MRRAWVGIVAVVLSVCCPAAAGAAASPGWAVQPVPLPSGGTHGALFGVWCASAASCTATGAYAKTARKGFPLVEHWNGSRWVAQAAAGPAGVVGSTLDAVSCATASRCSAVGYATKASEAQTALAERWNGSTWAIQAVPIPAGADYSELTGVWCVAVTNCIAVGSYSTGPASDVPLAERWNGSTWAIQALPSLSSQASLAAISCASARSCTAAGNQIPGTFGQPLAEHWNGSSWAVQAVPIPAGALSGGLSAVSCASAASCAAVGSYTTKSAIRTLAEQWDGTTWAVRPTPTPSGADTQSLTLAGVWCVSPASCTAAGSYVATTAPNVSRALAEYWDGSAWALEPTATPAGNKMLAAVTCTSAHTCTAVGVAPNIQKGSNKDLPLAERE